MSDYISGYSYLRSRAIVPAKPNPSEGAWSPVGSILRTFSNTPTRSSPDLRNVQGDVCLVFPKKFEYLLLFEIKDTTEFRKRLHKYSSLITSAAKTIENIYIIDQKKADEHLDIVSYGIAFSGAGLKKLAASGLDVDKPLGEPGMEGSDSTGDGVILVASMGDRDTAKKQIEEIKDLFEGSITIVESLEGRVRPDNRSFFDWKDGISQPALEGLTVPWPGQIVVKPGVIILGYPGDPLYDDGVSRPDFTKDGSFMVFRKFGQSIPLFEKYIEDNWEANTSTEPERSLTPHERKELFGARLFGRFKSGVPLALCPYKEDLTYLDPALINNFDYTERQPSQGCPLHSHSHKTNPRMGSPETSLFVKYLQIVRASIPYGEDITDEEREEYKRIPEAERDAYDYEKRGLIFVCYQSSTINGFHRQFKNAHDFTFPRPPWQPKLSVGHDPLVGNPQTILVDAAEEPEDPKRFVHMFKDPRGTYFVPGIPTVKAWSTPN